MMRNRLSVHEDLKPFRPRIKQRQLDHKRQKAPTDMIQLLSVQEMGNSHFEEVKNRPQACSSLLGDHRLTPLVYGFMPGQFDVICARGAEVKKHAGNRKFKELVQQSVESYASAKTKLYKSLVVSSIVDYFRSNSPEGGFVKEVNGEWYDVGEQLAREKVGQALRDQLSHQYKSSTKAKRRRWRQEAKQKKVTCEDIFDDTVKSNPKIITSMISLESQRHNFERDDASDDEILTMFTESNQALLDVMGSDSNLQETLRRASV